MKLAMVRFRAGKEELGAAVGMISARASSKPLENYLPRAEMTSAESPPVRDMSGRTSARAETDGIEKGGVEAVLADTD